MHYTVRDDQPLDAAIGRAEERVVKAAKKANVDNFIVVGIGLNRSNRWIDKK